MSEVRCNEWRRGGTHRDPTGQEVTSPATGLDPLNHLVDGLVDGDIS